jgi:hypothetical protein
MQKLTTLLAALILAVGLAFLASVLIAYPVKWLWNWLIPEIFTGVKEISALQAWGLVFLLNLMIPNRNRSEKRSE